MSIPNRKNALYLILSGLLVLALIILPNSIGQASSSQAPFSLALIGDMPYDAKGQAQTPSVINEINQSEIQFTLFDGDTMSGKGDKCTDDNYTRIKSDFFDKFARQIFYSIGDNEWTDCDRAVKGAFNPNERLAKVRSIFFRNSGKYINLGQRPLLTQVLHDSIYPEMQMFTFRGITVIIPHVVGSANNAAVARPAYRTYNDTATDGDDAEYKLRDAANVAWIEKGFQKAVADRSLGVIVVVQADMDWQGYNRKAASPDNEYTQAFDNTKQALLTNAIKFKKPVLLQNGDAHWYQVDKPMNETGGKIVEGDKGSLMENFTRVQTFGSGFNHWVQLVVNPQDPNLFSFIPHIIKSNLDVHTPLS